MKFLKFTIQNYRAIESATIDIQHNRLIPIIGINESGKTSILYAILCFHKEKDTFAPEKKDGRDNQGAHLVFKNNYYIGKQAQTCTIKADVLLERKEEVDDIAGTLELPRGGEVEQQMLNHLEKGHSIKKPIVICRELKRDEKEVLSSRYFVENTAISAEQNEKFAEAIYEHTPNILYFKTFENDIDDPITIPKTYLENKDTGSKREWRDLLQEIFKSATKKTIQEEYSIQDFLNLETNGDVQGSVIRAINNQLNEDIMDEWKRLSQEGVALNDDSFSKLSLEIKFIPKNAEGTPEFKIKVVDETTDSPSGRDFSINNRSTGLRWFFNFIIKLKYNFDYKNSGALFLLDEPGSNLHSTAQKGLLNKLSQIAKEYSPIIFGTHSQDLLDPDLINVASIKIAKREGYKVNIKNFNKADYKLNEGAWTPINRALHLKAGFAQFADPVVIITEGITDYYLFKMIQKFTNHIDKSYKFIPGAGAHQLKDLISMAIASADKFLVLLDSDRAGREAHKKYSQFFGEKEAGNFYMYETPTIATDILLENFIAREDREKLNVLIGLGRVTGNDVNEEIKNAIIILYNCRDANKIKEFIEGLSRETLHNLSELFSRIGKLADNSESETKSATE